MIYAQMVGRNEEERFLEQVLERLSQQVDGIVFTDDCSTDNTKEILGGAQAYASRRGFVVNEKEVLKECQKLLDRCGKLDFFLCGHNLKNFDIPMTAKRMIINGLLPPSILPSYDTKPWEIKAIDTMDVWKMGNNFALSSLELMCAAMGVKSPKEGEVTGNRVHEAYYDFNQLDLIVEYCERDVMVLIDIIKKFKELQ